MERTAGAASHFATIPLPRSKTVGANGDGDVALAQVLPRKAQEIGRASGDE